MPGPPTASRIAPSRELNIRVAAFKTKRNHDSPPEPSRFVLNRAALITRTPATFSLSLSLPFIGSLPLFPFPEGRGTPRATSSNETVSSLNDYALRIDRELISREIFFDAYSRASIKINVWTRTRLVIKYWNGRSVTKIFIRSLSEGKNFFNTSIIFPRIFSSNDRFECNFYLEIYFVES